MIMKALGLMDIIIALMFFLNNNFAKIHEIMPGSWVIGAGIILLIKGIFFLVFLDFASIIDIVCALVIILSGFMHIYWLLAFIVVLFLIQKGLLSLVS